MPSFSLRSRRKLNTLHVDLQKVLQEGIQWVDFTIISGFRAKEKQTEAYRTGRSTKPWPESTHNYRCGDGNPCSLGVDVAPWFREKPHVRWDKPGAFIYVCARLIQIGVEMDLALRWGGDWDMDTELYDQNFNDWGHLELTGPSIERLWEE